MDQLKIASKIKLLLSIDKFFTGTPEVGAVMGYQLTLFGPRGADYAPHITTGPPIFLDYAAPLYYIVHVI